MKIAFITNSQSVDSFASIAQALETSGNTVDFIEPAKTMGTTLMQEKPDVCYCDASLGSSLVAVKELLEALDIDYVGSQSATLKALQDPRYIATSLNNYQELSGEFMSAWAPIGIYFSESTLATYSVDSLAKVIEEHIPGGFPILAQQTNQIGTFSVVESLESLEALLEECASSNTSLYLVQMIDGVALTVPVLGFGYNAYALAPVDAKTMQAPVSNEVLSSDEAVAQAIRAEIERAATEAYRVCGVQDFACVYVVWDGARACIMGIDVAPSVEEGSCLALSCQVAGISLPGLFDALLAE